MYARVVFAIVLIACFCSKDLLLAQSIPGALSQPSTPMIEERPPRDFPSPFNGDWAYRSFRSDPNLNTSVEDLLFGAGTLMLSTPTMEKLSGTLGGEGWELSLKGSAALGNPAVIRFQGKGMIGDEEWVYDYVGYLVPLWPNGVDQRPAIVGSIVRTAPHSNGQATAGYVAQWIAVKKDQDAGEKLSVAPARSWHTTDSEGNGFDAEQLSGKSSVLLFTKGFDCLHCNEQVNVFSNAVDAFKQRDVHVVFFIDDSADAISDALGKRRLGDFRFAADPGRSIFRSYGGGENDDSHGFVLLDSNGRVCQRKSGKLPLTDVEQILEMIDSQPR